MQNVCTIPAKASGHGPAPEATAGPPARAERRRRAQALRDEADAAERYWIQLGGHPGARDRAAIREGLREGRPLDQLLGSIAERVRDELLAAGRLRPADPWPPPGQAPFDRRDALEAPPVVARAAEAELAAAGEAWEHVSEALRARVKPQAWATWIRPCRGLYVREGRLVVETPRAQHLDWIGRMYSTELHWAAAEAGLEGVDLVMAPPVAMGE